MWKWITIVFVCFILLQVLTTDNDAEPEVKKIESKIETDRSNERLIQAAEGRDTETIKRLIEDGVDINTKDSEGRTATMIATYNNDVQSAKVLLSAGADVNIQDNMKNNPFLYAGAEGYIEILKLSIEAGADPRLINRYGGTALIPASEHGHIDAIKELLTKTDIDVNHINNLGWTALLEAIVLNNGGEKQQKTIQMLIDHGADVTIPDKNNITPLQHAREREFKEIEQILLEAERK